MASNPANLASTDNEEAEWDQLSRELLEGLVGKAKAEAGEGGEEGAAGAGGGGGGGGLFGVQDGFMGPDWAEVVGEDAERFAANHPLSPVPTPDRVAEGSHGEMRWIHNNDDLKNSEY